MNWLLQKAVVYFQVLAGEGRVYQCLFNHKFDPQMSEDCRVALTGRQQVIAEDYKVKF